MYSVTVRGHMMIAHSLKGEVFGPAQQLHGATYVADVEFRRADLAADGMLVVVRRATKPVHAVLGSLSYRNLDEDPAFARTNTTTEILARAVFDRVRSAIRGGDLGEGGRRVTSLRVTLQESHVASAS